MADSALLRKTRERAHRRGDHSLCRPEFCPQTEARAARPAGELELAVTEFVDALRFDAEDPRAVIGLVAEKLARALDERASAAVARELRSSVEYLCDDPNADGDRVDEVRAKRAARRLGLLLSGMGD